jgi:phospho-N-acetylmuramoyl-pentapeptide-transferase
MAYWAYFKLGWDYIWMPFLGNIHIGFLYPIFVFLLFIIVLNSVGFTDGLDGLAGGLAFFSFVTFWAISRSLEYNSLAGFCATFAGALLPFLYFNVFPARIMMGNVGSHVLGATLAVLAVTTHREVAFIIIGLVFLIDGVTSPLQQISVKLTGKRLFRMAPIHHHFEKLGWPETKVTFRFWIFGIFFALLGFFISML